MCKETLFLLSSSLLFHGCLNADFPLSIRGCSALLVLSILVCSYELGAVYLQLCELLYVAENKNFDKLVDPSIFIPKFTNSKFLKLIVSPLTSFFFFFLWSIFTSSYL